METDSINNGEPLKIISDFEYGITPFGIYCLQCNRPIGGNVPSLMGNNVECIRKHNTRKNHQVDRNQNITKNVSLLEKAIKKKFGNIKNLEPWLLDKNIQMFRCSCGMATTKKSNITRHIETKKKDGNDSELHIIDEIQCVLTTCGRNIDVDVINEMVCKPTNVTIMNSVGTRSSSTSSSIKTPSTLTSSGNYDRNFDQFIPLKSDNSKWQTVTIENVRQVFKRYKRMDETLDTYLPLLKLMVIWCEGSVVNRLERDINLMDGVSETEEILN